MANGVIGFGLDSKSDFDLLLDGASQVLKPGGVFILGYNDKPRRLTYNIRSADNFNLFEEFVPDIDDLDASFIKVDDAYDPPPRFHEDARLMSVRELSYSRLAYLPCAKKTSILYNSIF